MVHYGDPQWYHDNVLPVRNRFWPEESTLYKPPRNAADLKTELAELRTLRITNKERREQGLPPLPAPVRSSSEFPSEVIRNAESEEGKYSLRDGASLGTIWMKGPSSQRVPAQRARTWRETWQEATEHKVV